MGAPLYVNLHAEDRDSIARVRAGDPAAFVALFEAYYPGLRGLAYSYVRDVEVAQELAQDVFCAVWERRASWDPVGGVRAYLFGAVRNRALRHLEHERLVRQTASERRADCEARTMAPAEAADRRAEATEVGQAFRRALHALPERQRLVATLRWQHQLSHAEIARVLRISVKGVETHLGRAVKRLRVLLAAFRR